MPGKSSGFNATVAGSSAVCSSRAWTPVMRMSKPFLIWWVVILEVDRQVERAFAVRSALHQTELTSGAILALLSRGGDLGGWFPTAAALAVGPDTAAGTGKPAAESRSQKHDQQDRGCEDQHWEQNVEHWNLRWRPKRLAGIGSDSTPRSARNRKPDGPPNCDAVCTVHRIERLAGVHGNRTHRDGLEGRPHWF